MTGIMNVIERSVDDNMTAEALGSGELNVLATPAMVALIESMGADALGVNCSLGPDRLGDVIGNRQIVKIGLYDGDKVVIKGVQKLKHGAKVQAETVSADLRM